MAMVYKLTGGKNGRNKLGFVNQIVQTGFQNTDEVFGRVAASSDRFDIIFVELFLGNVAVIGFQLLFGMQLFTVVGLFFSSLSMLPRSIFSSVQRTFRIAPDVAQITASRFFFAETILFIKFSFFKLRYCPGSFGS